MRHLFEQFASAEGNWQNSAIMLNVRSKKKGTRHGKYIWRKYEDVKAQYLDQSYIRLQPYSNL